MPGVLTSMSWAWKKGGCFLLRQRTRCSWISSAREAVEIDLGNGNTFRIAGRIDRIDKVGEASFEVLDYKTGSYWEPNWTGIFQGGRLLQHALYGLAAAELLKTPLRIRRSLVASITSRVVVDDRSA